MPLSWNEIRQRAITFHKDWLSPSRERAEAQTFWNEFFNVFGIRRQTVASFEEPVKNLKGDTEFIDLFWPGKLIAEHKTRGRNLAKAHAQAIGYVQNLANSGREQENPRWIIVSDFARIALHDLEETDPTKQSIEFSLDELPKHIRKFAFIAGYETRKLDPEDPVNVKAVELLGNVHDHLEDGGYTGHDLQRFMVRILFCLFADDTGIFEPDAFKLFLQQRTHIDGSDLGSQLARFFSVLNQKTEQRQKNLDESLAELPYVNGELFAEALPFAEFSSAMRNALLCCCDFHWDKISPAVFGSLFQSIMEGKERRQIGAHYTSERDILKLIRSLFLDDLRSEFDNIRTDKKKLEAFHRKLGRLNFLDPACGCGNFLIIAYRELRRLEMDLLGARFGENISEGDIRAECRLNVSQMFGIEIEEWPARIAEVALWLMDHQMNAELFERFGQVRATTPLTKSPNIRIGNALRTDWNDVLPAKDCSFVMGNPPFVGKHYRTALQTADLVAVTGDFKNTGDIDYVAGWYFKALDYIQDHEIRCAFVSTNSITQGEQAAVLWPALFHRMAGLKLHFAHRTFKWASEARGKAHVHVVIIGFGQEDRSRKLIYDYDADPDHPSTSEVRNITPYLTEGPDGFVIAKKQKPLSGVAQMRCGNKPSDGGNLILSDEEAEALTRSYPNARSYLKRFTGSVEFINGGMRWCLWLEQVNPADIRSIEPIMTRLEKVKKFRNESTAIPTQRAANTPGRFFFVSQPTTEYLAIPEVSSETRRFIPIGFLPPSVIASNKIYLVATSSRYYFGILSSTMHMAWMRQVGGRLKSDYQYSGSLVYNTFPWPQEVTDKQKKRVEEAAQAVLDARAAFPDSTLADLYDPLSMPAKLVKAHAELDRAVDACYRSQPFTTERQRVEYLFNLYEQLDKPLAPSATNRPKRCPRSK